MEVYQIDVQANFQVVSAETVDQSAAERKLISEMYYEREGMRPTLHLISQSEEFGSSIGENSFRSPFRRFDHLRSLVDGPDADVLVRRLAFPPERLSVTPDETGKVHREGSAGVPEVATSESGGHADVGESDVREELDGGLDVFRMPESENESGAEGRLVVGMGGD